MQPIAPMPNDRPLITVNHLVRIIRARWLSAVGTVAVMLAIAVAVTLLMPKRYVAAASVLVDVKSPDPINGVMMQGMMAPSYMNTQVDLIGSETVARRVVRDLQLDKDPAALASWQAATHGEGDREAWLVEWLGKGLDVKPTHDSNLLRVGYSSRSRQFAAAAANAFVKAYVDITLELRVAPAKQYKQFFDASAQQLRDALEVAQRKLSA